MSEGVGDVRTTLLYASPTYGHVDPQALRSQRAAIMHSSNHGVRWAGDISPDRMGFVAARNEVVRQALLAADEDPSIDGVMWADSDMLLPPDSIAKLADGLRRGAEFMTGVYFQRGGHHFPLIAHFDKDRRTFSWLVEVPDSVFAPVDGCGFGICLTSIKLLRALVEVHGAPFEWVEYGEDLTFCLRAKALGMPPHVDTSVMAGHLMDPLPATYETFKAAGSGLSHLAEVKP